jgi:hypothetical protein
VAIANGVSILGCGAAAGEITVFGSRSSQSGSMAVDNAGATAARNVDGAGADDIAVFGSCSRNLSVVSLTNAGGIAGCLGGAAGKIDAGKTGAGKTDSGETGVLGSSLLKSAVMAAINARRRFSVSASRISA